jgi:peptidoglycan-N-acetylglucosamine deacetylase
MFRFDCRPSIGGGGAKYREGLMGWARRALKRFAAIALAIVAASATMIVMVAPTSAAAAVSTAAAATRCAGYVALTFDDGPNPTTTRPLLAALRAARLRATMFNIGVNAQQNPDLTRAQRAAGMWVANHSWTHPHLPQLTRREINEEIWRTNGTLRRLTGHRPTLFRPPFGDTNDTVRAAEARFGLTEILWSVDSQDWNGATTEQIVQAAARLQPGGIILMHDNFQTTIDAIPLIADVLRSRGLCAGAISPVTGLPVPAAA